MEISLDLEPYSQRTTTLLILNPAWMSLRRQDFDVLSEYQKTRGAEVMAAKRKHLLNWLEGNNEDILLRQPVLSLEETEKEIRITGPDTTLYMWQRARIREDYKTADELKERAKYFSDIYTGTGYELKFKKDHYELANYYPPETVNGIKSHLSTIYSILHKRPRPRE